MDGDILPLDEAERIFDRMRSYPDYTLYVADADGEIVGTFALAVMDNLAHMGGKSALIEDVVVARDKQGSGVGTRMTRFALDVCREKGCYKVSLSSNIKREMAHRFYERLGFRIHGYSFLTELE